MHEVVISEIVAQGMRLVFLLTLPIVGAIALAGIIVGALQSVTNIHEPAISLLARIVALVSVLYLLWSDISQALQELLIGVLR